MIHSALYLQLNRTICILVEAGDDKTAEPAKSAASRLPGYHALTTYLILRSNRT